MAMRKTVKLAKEHSKMFHERCVRVGMSEVGANISQAIFEIAFEMTMDDLAREYYSTKDDGIKTILEMVYYHRLDEAAAAREVRLKASEQR